MKLVGFNFDKLSVEKTADKTSSLSINTNINILEIKEIKADFFESKQSLLNVGFSYVVDYSPDFAKVEIKGNLFFEFEPKTAKEILKKWKDKEILEGVKESLFNIILKKATLKALFLEEEANLPLHIPFPSLKKLNQENKEEANI